MPEQNDPEREQVAIDRALDAEINRQVRDARVRYAMPAYTFNELGRADIAGGAFYPNAPLQPPRRDEGQVATQPPPPPHKVYEVELLNDKKEIITADSMEMLDGDVHFYRGRRMYGIIAKGQFVKVLEVPVGGGGPEND